VRSRAGRTPSRSTQNPFHGRNACVLILRGDAEPWHIHVMRLHRLRIVFLLALPLLLPGCLFFGFGCDIVGSAFQGKAPPGTNVHTTNAISRDRLDTVVEDEVCVPSLTS
jgi:hypothetical protein